MKNYLIILLSLFTFNASCQVHSVGSGSTSGVSQSAVTTQINTAKTVLRGEISDSGALVLERAKQFVRDTTISPDTTIVRTITSRSISDSLVKIRTGIFNVLDYGAIGDSSHADRKYIQAAINACKSNGGGIVYFPAGIYLCDSTLTVDANYVHLIGQGDASRLTFTTALNSGIGVYFKNSSLTNHITESSIENIMIHLYHPNSIGIKSRCGISGMIKHTTVIYMGGGLAANNKSIGIIIAGRGEGHTYPYTTNMRVEYNRINWVHKAVFIDSAANAMIKGNSFYGNSNSQDTGYVNNGYGSSGSLIEGNQMENYLLAVLDSGYFERIVNNRFEQNTKNIKIAANTFPGQYNYGYMVSGNAHASLTGTNALDIPLSGRYALYINDASVGSVVFGSLPSTNETTVNLFGRLGISGPSLGLYNGAVSLTNPILRFTTFGASSHTNNFNETSTNIESNIYSLYNIKFGTVGNYPISIYTNNTLRLRIPAGGIPTYADNAAAISGGLSTNDVYRTSTGVLMIVYIP